MSQLSLYALEGFPLVAPGDELAPMILDRARAAGTELAPYDVVVVTGKVVSKAEGRFVRLADVAPSERAVRLAARTGKDPRLVELVLQESVAVVRARPNVLLVRHRLGFISAAAGIDRSNVGSDDDTVLLLPEDPDASAARLCEAFAAAGAPNLAVVLSDSHGRAFRHGNVGVAIGAAGLPALIDLEGQPDLFGRPLTTASRLPLADLVASAATLVTGESAEGRPVVVVRGLQWTLPPGRASDLVRPVEQDLFAAADEDYG